MRDRKRKRNALTDCVFASPVSCSRTSTGLTQIVNMLDISEPTERTSKRVDSKESPVLILTRSPLKSVLKNR